MKRLALCARGEKNLIKTGGAAVEDPKPVFSAFDAEERLNFPVNRVLVAQHTVSVQLVEDDLPVFVEEYILQDQGNVISAARQPERMRIGIVLVAGILLIKTKKEAIEDRVHIGGCADHPLVVLSEHSTLYEWIMAHKTT